MTMANTLPNFKKTHFFSKDIKELRHNIEIKIVTST